MLCLLKARTRKRSLDVACTVVAAEGRPQAVAGAQIVVAEEVVVVLVIVVAVVVAAIAVAVAVVVIVAAVVAAVAVGIEVAEEVVVVVLVIVVGEGQHQVLATEPLCQLDVT